ncbi:UNVERIFIED_CONTAM: hypothetical protein FKN15_037417 [Acipenser sinensis]
MSSERCTHIFYFTSVKLFDALLKKGLPATGTIKSRIPRECQVVDGKSLQRLGRGVAETTKRRNPEVVVTKWYNTCVLMALTVHEIELQDSCRRWSNKEKQYLQVSRPAPVREYNGNMAGVDMCDRMISFYRVPATVEPRNGLFESFSKKIVSYFVHSNPIHNQNQYNVHNVKAHSVRL